MTIEDVYYHVKLPNNIKDFWELNQELSFINPFMAFKKKKNSAKIMMAIYMIYDPKSQLNNSGIDQAQIKKEVSANFLGDEKFDWSEHREIINAYKIVAKTKLEKQLDNWWLQLRERDEYLNNDLEWGEGEDDTKERMLLGTDKHYEKYNQIASSLKEERQEKLMYGDYTPSMLENWSLLEDG